MNSRTTEIKWLKENGLTETTAYTLPIHLVQAQKIAFNLLKHNSQYLKHNEIKTLNNFLKAMSFTNLRVRLTNTHCLKVMNIGTSVNRKLFKAYKSHEAFKR